MKAFLIYFLFGIMGYNYIQLVKLGKSGVDSYYGTLTFWKILNLVTIGIGGLIFLGVNHIVPDGFVYKRPKGSVWYMWLPMFTAMDCMLLGRFLPWKTDHLSPLFLGMMVVGVEVLSVFLNPYNRAIQIQETKELGERLGTLVSSGTLRKKMHRVKSGAFYFKHKGEQILVKKLSKQELDECLLIEEKRGRAIRRRYRKPDGKVIEAIEVEGLLVPKLWNCMAGMILLLLVTSPYVPYVYQMIRGWLGGK